MNMKCIDNECWSISWMQLNKVGLSIPCIMEAAVKGRNTNNIVTMKEYIYMGWHLKYILCQIKQLIDYVLSL